MDELTLWLKQPPSARPPLETTEFAWRSLSKHEARTALSLIADARRSHLQRTRRAEMDAECIEHPPSGLSLRFSVRRYRLAPPGQRRLLISLHGGGGCPAATNDQQWANQLSLYKPDEGFCVAPRAPTNTWDLWHQPHIDPLFDRLIENFVVLRGVDPNRVYIAGYSAGGDGAYRLAPRMADRWGAAAMMAGHPGEARPGNLNNTPYFIQCGGKDAAYERNARAREWGDMLGRLARENPGEYEHQCVVYPQHGHWMNKDCRQAIPWMTARARKPWPKKLMWQQGNVLHKRFAWIMNKSPRPEDEVRAEVRGQQISVESDNVSRVTLRLCDELLDLDQAVTVKSRNNVVFHGKVRRCVAPILQSLEERFDISTTATAFLDISIR